MTCFSRELDRNISRTFAPLPQQQRAYPRVINIAKKQYSINLQ